MDDYYVTFRSKDGYRRQERYSADDFAHAEEQAMQHVAFAHHGHSDEEIIAIEKDYK